MDADLLEVVLDGLGDRRLAGQRDVQHGEFEPAVPGRLQELPCLRGVVRVVGAVGLAVRGRGLGPGRGGRETVPAEGLRDEPVAVDGPGERLADGPVVERGDGGVDAEVHRPGAGVVVADGEPGVALDGAEALAGRVEGELGLAGAQGRDQRVGLGYDPQFDAVEVGTAGLPVRVVAREAQSGAGAPLLQFERAGPDEPLPGDGVLDGLPVRDDHELEQVEEVVHRVRQLQHQLVVAALLEPGDRRRRAPQLCCA